jgi:hypothetical protein
MANNFNQVIFDQLMYWYAPVGACILICNLLRGYLKLLQRSWLRADRVIVVFGSVVLLVGIVLSFGSLWLMNIEYVRTARQKETIQQQYDKDMAEVEDRDDINWLERAHRAHRRETLAADYLSSLNQIDDDNKQQVRQQGRCCLAGFGGFAISALLYGVWRWRFQRWTKCLAQARPVP